MILNTYYLKAFTFFAIIISIQSCNTEITQSKDKSTPEALLIKEARNESDPFHTDTNLRVEDINLEKQTLVSAGQFKSYKEIYINGSSFNAVIEENKDTVYLATNDTKFQTPEKYRVGMKFSQIPIELKHSINREIGWGYYLKLKSNWCLGFCEGKSCTDQPITPDSKVKWIFKRKN